MKRAVLTANCLLARSSAISSVSSFSAIVQVLSFETTLKAGHLISQMNIDQCNWSARTSNLAIEGQAFRLEHLLLDASSHTAHELHLCAAGRAVETEKLTDMIPSLRGPLRNDADRQFFYTVCVYGDLLDTSVDSTRTRLVCLMTRTCCPARRTSHGKQSGDVLPKPPISSSMTS